MRTFLRSLLTSSMLLLSIIGAYAGPVQPVGAGSPFTAGQCLQAAAGNQIVTTGSPCGGGGGGAVSSVFGRTGAVTAQSGDYIFSQIGSLPTTLSGYGITDALSTTLSSAHLIVGNGSNIATAVSLSGDCSLSNSGAITCTKTNGTSFGAFATGTNAANLTGTLPTTSLPTSGVATGSCTLCSITFDTYGRSTSISGGSVSFSQISSTPTTLSGYGITNALSTALTSADIIVGNGSNIATAVGLSGDCSLSNAGAITCTKTNGTSFGSFATGTNAANLTGTLPVGSLPTSGAASGSCTFCSITADSYGRVTAISSGTASGWPALGVTNGTGASAGYVGEVIESDGSTTVGVSSGTPVNASSVTLAAGDYLCSGNVAFTGTSITTAGTGTSSYVQAGLSIHSASGPYLNTSYVRNLLQTSLGATGIAPTIGLPPVYVSVSSSTTIYLVAAAVFSGGTLNVTAYQYLCHRVY